MIIDFLIFMAHFGQLHVSQNCCYICYIITVIITLPYIR